MSWLKMVLVSLVISALASSGAMAAQATAEIKGASGDLLGTVTLIETPHGVLLFADLVRIPPGSHNYRVHEKITCTPDCLRIALRLLFPGKWNHDRTSKNPENSAQRPLVRA